jgi:phosphate starvation-inducible membrane PsiE
MLCECIERPKAPIPPRPEGRGFLEQNKMKTGHANLEEILLLFIYLKLGAMVGTYFKTRRLPVQFLIYIAITALSRHLVIDVQKVADSFHLYLLLSITIAIALLSVAILILSYTAKNYGCPEDSDIEDKK